MKDQIITAAGKLWRFLGENGEVAISDLARQIKEKEEIVFQALGWLAREDKISYTTKNKRSCVALIDSEQQNFRSVLQNNQSQVTQLQTKKRNNNRLNILSSVQN